MTSFLSRPFLVAALLVATAGAPATAQSVTEASPGEPVALTLEEAVEIALVNNYAIQSIRLDVDNAQAQVREAWGQVLPQVALASSYTRNLKSANPFAGSEAGGLFASFGFIDWLSYNERARTDDDPASAPIPFDEFIDRQRQGLQDAGIQQNAGANPFAVDNQFSSGISVSQTLFNGSAFAAIKGAERLKNINQEGVNRQEQLLIDQVRRSFYTALLAQERGDVVLQSVDRTDRTLQEVSKRVSQGVAPKFQRLSAEVELSNLETQLVQAQNQTALALDNLKMTLGIPVDQPLRLRGALEAADPAAFLTVSTQDAVDLALQRRPDLSQLRLAVELRQIDREIARSQYLPSVSAFANFNYTGSVPDNRTFTISDANDPFTFSSDTRGFFSSSYWNPSVNVGMRLSWTLFNGFQTSARLQQRQVAVDKARLDLAQQLQGVRLEVQRALRDLEAARTRILSQGQNVQRAELNYEYATARLREGVASQLEERNASEQLDQARLNYLQAVHDYLVAKSSFETAVGMPMAAPGDFRLTTND